jgi:ketosteroid isomerase-like protein
MNDQDGLRYVRGWISAWNKGDVEAVLASFAEAVTFTSPLAAEIVPGSGGVIQGKDALRAYWRRGLEQHPDLHFELVGAYVGIDTVVINYRNHADRLVSEVLRFDGPLVVEGHATHLAQAGPER